MSIARFLFSFRKPVVYNLEHLDIVIENKPLLLLSWSCKRSYFISIKPLKRRYRNKELSVVLKVPTHIDHINVIISTIWRKRVFRIALRKLKLNQDTAQVLIHQFKPMKMPAVKQSEIQLRKLPKVIGTPLPVLRNRNPVLKSSQIEMQSNKLVYPH